ncbi:MAG: hypothetical protein RSE47_00235 [Acidaminococcaceae bacterium]
MNKMQMGGIILYNLCLKVKKEIHTANKKELRQKVAEFLGKYPESPVPHNLLGIILEMENKHLTAMKHFRAAYALDPTYKPVLHNLDMAAELPTKRDADYGESDGFMRPLLRIVGGVCR